MAVSFLNREVSDLCLGKPPLKPIQAEATVLEALTALKKAGEPHVSVWSCDHSRKVLEEGGGGDSVCRCIGKICMVDVICFLCKEENLADPSKALQTPVSQILPKGNSIVRHLDPNSSLLEAIDYILEGAQNLVIPIQNYRSTPSRKRLLSKASSLSPTNHNGVEYCWLTQEDIVRFLLNSIGVFSPMPNFSIESLNIINHDVMTVSYHDPAISSLDAIIRAYIEQSSVAVVDEDNRLIGEISPFTLAYCDETVAAAITTLSAGDLMTYIDYGGPPEDLIELVKMRLQDKKLGAMVELIDEEFSLSSSSSSASSCSSDDESGSSKATVLVFDNVTVMFDDGSVCKVMKADPLRLKPVGRNGLEDGRFPFYPGQRVKASSSSLFKNSRWLSGSWKANRLEGTVTKVTVGSVLIYWIASAGYGPNSSTSPAEEQNPKNLKLMSCFSHAIWQLGDWCLLPSSSFALDKQLSKLQLCDSAKTVAESSQCLTDCDSEVINLEESTGNGECMEIDVESSVDGNSENLEHDSLAESSTCANSLSLSKESGQPLHRKKIRKVLVRRDKKARKKEENFERALLIVNTRTSVDVAWQDGKIEEGLESTSLIPIESPGDHEFVAQQYVVEKAADDADDSNDFRRVGVVKSVNAKERTASVRWLKPVTRAEDPKEFDKEEVVSVYELEGHPDYDYCYGDVVVRLLPVSLPAKVGSVVKSTEESEHLLVPTEAKEDEKKHSKCNDTEAAPNDDTCSQFSDLSWVGNITGLRNGDIEVTWADGMISLVGPQAIYVVDRDDDESIVAGSEVGDDAASWETVEDHERETLGNVEEELGATNATDISIEDEDGAMATEDSGRNAALAIPLAALGFVTRLASGIFSRGRKQTDSSSLDSRSEDEEREGALAKIFTGDESCPQRSGDLDNSPRLPAAGNGEDHDTMEVTELDVVEANLKSGIGNSSNQHDDQTYSFKRFDITTDPYDHHFLGTSGQTNAGRKWLKKVQQDWNILQNNLPDGIYVRVYEDHMDLLRAVIVGAYGTPYQDGLFFFDFHLPPEYPDVPPSAYYHSGGWRINPNLYEEGKVCLSLLNTWTGRGNEVWDPSSSSILQVLVSLQGLVLNSRPYFNEAGYDKQVGTAEGEKNSLSYNENTFLLNCKTMMYLMRKPPKDFEELIREHFKMRGYYILKACDAYMQGFLIGSLIKDASVSSNSSANSNSVGFKLMLAKIVPKLFLALKEIGVECEEFKHLHQL